MLHKLHSYDIAGNALAWIKSFLTERKQCTRVGNSVSDYEYLISGVVQGSCLGPLLFVIYINDIAELFNQQCVCKLYADDLKLYMCMNLPSFASDFQYYLDKLTLWSNTWQLNISHKKCSVMQVGSRKTNYAFSLASNPLCDVNAVRDLGVLIDRSLKFDNHIRDIVTRACTRANLIHKCFRSRDTSTLVRAYITYVRPLLEYASSVWSPHLLKDIKRVESVQRRFTKRLPGMGDKTYSRRLTDIGLESLELRRLQQDLVLTYKILFSKLVVNYENMFNVRLHSRTRGHDWKLMTSHSHIDIRKHFHCVRVVAPWNSLNMTVNDLNSVKKFRSLVKKSDLTQFLYYV